MRLVAATESLRDWSIHQLDVKSAFLNRPLEEKVYVCQPQGLVAKGI